jgi:hypothetical protein
MLIVARPFREQMRLRVKYSSSEWRTLIVRDRSFRTVTIALPEPGIETQDDPVYSQELMNRKGRNNSTWTLVESSKFSLDLG